MNRLKNILVIADFSPWSRAALAQAARMAKWNKAKLHLLHTIEESDIRDAAEAMRQGTETFQKRVVRQAEQSVLQLLKKARLATRPKWRVRVGTATELLLEEIEAVKADLVAVGLRGNGDDPRGVGMLATRALRKTGTKVMLVEKRKTRRFRRIVACVDFSDTAREVVAQALRVAAQDGCRVDFLHVFFPPWQRLGYRAASPAASVQFARDYRARQLVELAAWVGDTGEVRSTFTVLDSPSAGQAIAEHTRATRADLVVLGRRGRSPLGYLLMGSTVERLARELQCSLLAVRRLQPLTPFEPERFGREPDAAQSAQRA